MIQADIAVFGGLSHVLVAGCTSVLITFILYGKSTTPPPNMIFDVRIFQEYSSFCIY